MADRVLMDGFIQAEGQYPRLTALGSKVLLLVCYSGFRSVKRPGSLEAAHRKDSPCGPDSAWA
jgi:hypothetical protein